MLIEYGEHNQLEGNSITGILITDKELKIARVKEKMRQAVSVRVRTPFLLTRVSYFNVTFC